MIFVPKLTQHLLALCAQPGSRFSMQGVRVLEYAPDEGMEFGQWRLEATDGRVAAVLRGHSYPGRDDVPGIRLFPDLPEGEDVAFEGVVPGAAFLEAVKGVQKERSLGIALRSKTAVLLADDRVGESALLEGRFPEIDAVLPRRAAAMSILVDPEQIVRLLKLGAEVSRDNRRGQPPRVWLHFFAPDQPLGLTADGPQGTYLDMLAMPFIEPK